MESHATGHANMQPLKFYEIKLQETSQLPTAKVFVFVSRVSHFERNKNCEVNEKKANLLRGDLTPGLNKMAGTAEREIQGPQTPPRL